MQISEVMVEEWLRNEVTQTLGKILNERLKWLVESRTEIFYPGDPQKTQEALATVTAQIAECTVLSSLLFKEVFLAEVADLEQLQRDHPNWVSSVGGTGPDSRGNNGSGNSYPIG